MRYLILIAALWLPNVLLAKIWDDEVKLTDMGPVNVIITDNAQDGCWTNLVE